MGVEIPTKPGDVNPDILFCRTIERDWIGLIQIRVCAMKCGEVGVGVIAGGQLFAAAAWRPVKGQSAISRVPGSPTSIMVAGITICSTTPTQRRELMRALADAEAAVLGDQTIN